MLFRLYTKSTVAEGNLQIGMPGIALPRLPVSTPDKKVPSSMPIILTGYGANTVERKHPQEAAVTAVSHFSERPLHEGRSLAKQSSV